MGSLGWHVTMNVRDPSWKTPTDVLSWTYDQPDRSASKVALVCGLRLGIPGVLRSLSHFLGVQSQFHGHHTTEERGAEGGSAPRSSFKG